jgi:hypothetical protein
MVKKFTAKCDFGGQKFPVNFYIGSPSIGSHPLNFQSKWLADNRGGNVPKDIMDAFEKLSEVSTKHRVAFEDLCEYVIEELNSTNTLASDVKQATALAGPSGQSKPQIQNQTQGQTQQPQTQQNPEPKKDDKK